MWKKKHITFLTQNHIDKDRIITVLEQYTSNSKDDQDKKILTGILKNFNVIKKKSQIRIFLINIIQK